MKVENKRKKRILEGKWVCSTREMLDLRCQKSIQVEIHTKQRNVSSGVYKGG